jgi:hypothetical protein
VHAGNNPSVNEILSHEKALFVHSKRAFLCLKLRAYFSVDIEAVKNSQFMRAMFSSEISFGHSTSRLVTFNINVY